MGMNYNNMQNAYSNPAFQQVAQAQQNIGQQNLQNLYGQQQQGALQNMANRFGGINTSMYNDAMNQNNRNMALGEANLANQYTGNMGNQYNQWANSTPGQMNFQQQQQQQMQQQQQQDQLMNPWRYGF